MGSLKPEIWAGIFAIAIGVSLPLVAPAFAADAGSTHAAMMAKVDTDHDGKISPAEWKAATDARFKTTDTNGDGFISPDEMKAAAEKRAAAQQTAHKDRSEKMFKRADTNGDGKLSEAEYEAASQKMYERMQSHKAAAPDAPPAKAE
jgi:hypothetical protein